MLSQLREVLNFTLALMNSSELITLSDIDPETQSRIASLNSLIRSQAFQLEQAQRQIAELNEQLVHATAKAAEVVDIPPPTSVRCLFS
jgi:uncharacterized coiled-coil protein SlyX